MAGKKNKGGNCIFYIVIVMAIIYFAFIFAQQQEQLSKLKRKEHYIQNKINKEEKTKEELTELHRYIDTDEYIEQIAREKLGYVKDKERLFVDINE